MQPPLKYHTSVSLNEEWHTAPHIDIVTHCSHLSKSTVELKQHHIKTLIYDISVTTGILGTLLANAWDRNQDTGEL